MNDCTLCVQSKEQVAIVHIDFSKAFDVVSVSYTHLTLPTNREV